MTSIYLDNNATTQVDEKVLEGMLPFFKQLYGNPSSIHDFGGKVGRHIESARKKVADLIGASPSEIIFTGCGTESDNTAIWSAIQSNPGKKHIITTRVEHPAIKNFCTHLSKNGFRVTYVPVNRDGELDMPFLLDSLTEDTAVVSIMWANNETGVIFPIEEIAGILKKRDIVFHTDAVQAVGKIPIDLSRTPVNMLSMSGHKIHAPKGIGALYVRRGTKFSPLIIGGHQERGRRGGTENTASIVGLGIACELAATYLEHQNTVVKNLRDRLEETLLRQTPNSHVNGRNSPRLSNTLSINFDYVEGESILLMLNELNICASSGSACTSGSLEPSHVLRAMGVPFTSAHGSIRFSLSTRTTEDEIDFVIEKMPGIIERLRKMSPFWNQNLNRGADQAVQHL